MPSLSRRPCVGALLLFASFVVLSPRDASPRGNFSLPVDARSNIFSAGHLTLPAPGGGGGGTFCFGVGVAGLDGQIVTFYSVTGQVSGALGWPAHDAEGNTGDNTDVNSYGGIAGLIVPGHSLCLVGVFLDGAEPVDPAPSRLDYTGGTGFTDSYPELRQVFFIGDGLTGTGTGDLQRFHVPSGAQYLYLGFADGWAYAGDPGWYDDNTGSLNVAATIGMMAQVSSMTFTSSSVKGGRKLKGTLQLSSPAPATGITIPILSNQPALVDGTFCYFNPGARSSKFSLSTHSVSSTKRIKVTAYGTNKVTKTVKLTR